MNALRARSIIEPFPVQQMVIKDALDGHDLLVQSPTGSGKTLAFGVPLVDIVEPGSWGPQALVLAPTRELASQIVDELEGLARARKVNLAAVYGGVGFGPQIARAKKADILVATPGRLEDLISRNAVSLDQVRVLVLDEADRMLDMGFRPAVDRIVNETPDDRQTLFFSATLDGMVGKVARDYTFKPRSAPQRAERERRHRHRAPLPAGRLAAGEARRTGRDAARRRARPLARLRPHQAWRRPAGQTPAHRERRGGRDARRQKPAPARGRARPLRAR